MRMCCAHPIMVYAFPFNRVMVSSLALQTVKDGLGREGGGVGGGVVCSEVTRVDSRSSSWVLVAQRWC